MRNNLANSLIILNIAQICNCADKKLPDQNLVYFNAIRFKFINIYIESIDICKRVIHLLKCFTYDLRVGEFHLTQCHNKIEKNITSRLYFKKKLINFLDIRLCSEFSVNAYPHGKTVHILRSSEPEAEIESPPLAARSVLDRLA